VRAGELGEPGRFCRAQAKEMVWECSPFPANEMDSGTRSTGATLEFITPDIGFVAIGKAQSYRTRGLVYKTEDGGRTWRTVLNNGSDCRGVHFVNENDVLMTCTQRHDAYHQGDVVVYTSTNGGTDWTVEIFQKEGTFEPQIRFWRDGHGGGYVYMYEHHDNYDFYRSPIHNLIGGRP
jgi:hypothetical protein